MKPWCVLLVCLAWGSALAGEASRVPRPVINTESGAPCVADTAFMKKNHMELIKHQRDDTVHRGMRVPKFSLKGCVNCHAGKTTHSVIKEPTDFCRSCHTYAGVTLDCFECHNATATPANAARPATAP